MIASRVEALPCQHFITGYSHGLLRPLSGSSEALFDRLVRMGVTQHYALAPGNATREIKGAGGYDWIRLCRALTGKASLTMSFMFNSLPLQRPGRGEPYRCGRAAH